MPSRGRIVDGDRRVAGAREDDLKLGVGDARVALGDRLLAIVERRRGEPHAVGQVVDVEAVADHGGEGAGARGPAVSTSKTSPVCGAIGADVGVEGAVEAGGGAGGELAVAGARHGAGDVGRKGAGGALDVVGRWS